ncbi:hypothetical protein [Bosea massiliensis]|jgi:hypothetical protein|uniref:Uncharacterized protein n=1 Tax=Bosea massiliensis TaxID=151419 RepID=A0ABW0NY69_9HYPH
MLAFEIEDSEFQFGAVSIGGDICLCIEGDGSKFELTHCFVENQPADAWLKERMASWIADDIRTLGPRSRVLLAYEERVISARDERAANLSDHRREQQRMAA